MTVNQLRKMLKNIDGKLEVVMAADAEGNDFATLYEIGPCHFVPHNPRWGDRGDIVSADDDDVNAICLWPS